MSFMVDMSMPGPPCPSWNAHILPLALLTPAAPAVPRSGRAQHGRSAERGRRRGQAGHGLARPAHPVTGRIGVVAELLGDAARAATDAKLVDHAADLLRDDAGAGGFGPLQTGGEQRLAACVGLVQPEHRQDSFQGCGPRTTSSLSPYMSLPLGGVVTFRRSLATHQYDGSSTRLVA